MHIGNTTADIPVKSHAFGTSRDLEVRRLTALWTGAQGNPENVHVVRHPPSEYIYSINTSILDTLWYALLSPKITKSNNNLSYYEIC